MSWHCGEGRECEWQQQKGMKNHVGDEGQGQGEPQHIQNKSEGKGARELVLRGLPGSKACILFAIHAASEPRAQALLCLCLAAFITIIW